MRASNFFGIACFLSRFYWSTIQRPTYKMSLDPPLQIPAIVRFGQEDEARKLNDQIKEAKKAAERLTERFSRHVVKRICNDRNCEVEFLHEWLSERVFECCVLCQPWLADPKSFLVFSNVIHENHETLPFIYLVSSIGFQSRTASVEAVKVVEQPKIDWANPPAELIEETDQG